MKAGELNAAAEVGDVDAVREILQQLATREVCPRKLVRQSLDDPDGSGRTAFMAAARGNGSGGENFAAILKLLWSEYKSLHRAAADGGRESLKAILLEEGGRFKWNIFMHSAKCGHRANLELVLAFYREVFGDDDELKSELEPTIDLWNVDAKVKDFVTQVGYRSMENGQSVRAIANCPLQGRQRRSRRSARGGTSSAAAAPPTARDRTLRKRRAPHHGTGSDVGSDCCPRAKKNKKAPPSPKEETKNTSPEKDTATELGGGFATRVSPSTAVAASRPSPEAWDIDDDDEEDYGGNKNVPIMKEQYRKEDSDAKRKAPVKKEKDQEEVVSEKKISVEKEKDQEDDGIADAKPTASARKSHKKRRPQVKTAEKKAAGKKSGGRGTPRSSSAGAAKTGASDVIDLFSSSDDEEDEEEDEDSNINGNCSSASDSESRCEDALQRKNASLKAQLKSKDEEIRRLKEALRAFVK